MLTLLLVASQEAFNDVTGTSLPIKTTDMSSAMTPESKALGSSSCLGTAQKDRYVRYHMVKGLSVCRQSLTSAHECFDNQAY